jgi:hypothetical protein
LAPAIALRLTGGAKEVVREVPINLLMYGIIDPLTQQQTSTGLDVLLNGLQRRFGQLALESTIMHIVELITFRRRSSESIDEALTRFEALRTRYDNNVQNFQMPVPALAWSLLEALRVPRSIWPVLFVPFGGQLPQDDPMMAQLIQAIRQQCHIAEHPQAGEKFPRRHAKQLLRRS